MTLEKKVMNKHALAIGLVTAIFTTNSHAGELIIETTYTEGDTLTASSLNGNMSAVKTAVDDNNARITVNENQLELHDDDITANVTRLDMFDDDINANVTRLNTHESDISSLRSRVTGLENPGSYVISIGHSAFKDAGSPSSVATPGDCIFTGAFANYIYPELVATATNDQCFASAGVQLPDGATISRLECTFLDNSASNNMNAHLNRTNLLTGVNTSVLRTDPTTDSTSVQTKSDTTFNTAGSEVIENSIYGYNLFLNFSTTNFSSLGANARLYGCRITVE